MQSSEVDVLHRHDFLPLCRLYKASDLQGIGSCFSVALHRTCAPYTEPTPFSSCLDTQLHNTSHFPTAAAISYLQLEVSEQQGLAAVKYQQGVTILSFQQLSGFQGDEVGRFWFMSTTKSVSTRF